ncbi:MAG: type II toxin-antitoxin system HicA family toxin [Candidatus Peregrinibacteria bacterium]
MPYTYREVSRKLKDLGFTLLRHGKGSHVVFGKKEIRVIVPNHGGKTISPGVERKIIGATGLSGDEFRKV